MRKDGIRLKKIDPMRRIMLYIFNGRNNSVVYSPEEIRIDHLLDFLKNINSNNPNKISTLHIVIASLIRTVSKYPYLNRFVAAKKLYARTSFSVSFVVLKNINGKEVETIAKIYFNLDDTLIDIAKKIDDNISLCRSSTEKSDDKLMEFFSKLPSPLLSICANSLKFLSDRGLVPKSFQDSIPLFSSIFISNLGSIGHDYLFHHLYEWGTTSIFLTLGRKTKTEHGTFLKVGFSCDERIADGIYLVKALRYFNNLISNPEKLLDKPSVIVKDDGI